MRAVQWRLRGHGSALLVWDVGNVQLEIPSSYVGDAFEEFMRVALDLKRGSRSAFCLFSANLAGIGYSFPVPPLRHMFRSCASLAFGLRAIDGRAARSSGIAES